MFFPGRGEVQLALEAKLICMECPVFQQCRELQQRTKSEFGIWAAVQQTRGNDP